MYAKVTDSSTCQLGGDLTDLSGQYKAELNTELYDTELTLTLMNTSAQVVESLEYLGLHLSKHTQATYIQTISFTYYTASVITCK